MLVGAETSAYTKMIKEDKGTKLSDVTLARRLLRRSGLNHDEQRHVLASCNHEYNLDKIKTALRRRLLAQDKSGPSKGGFLNNRFCSYTDLYLCNEIDGMCTYTNYCS